MKKVIMLMCAAGILSIGIGIAQSAEKKVKMSDLPAAVQQAIAQQSKGATVKGLATEVEDGKTLYEAELMVNGHSKDVTFDAQGNVVDLEEQTSLDKIPAEARAAIQKAAGNGEVLLVETVTEKGVTNYEAQIKKGGKKSEVVVDAAGKAV